MTVAYVRERHQFGRPVGSFQALKHRLADLWVTISQARAAARYAAACLASGDPDTPVAVAVAKAVLLRCRAGGRAGMRPAARRHRLHLGASSALVPQARQGGLDRVRYRRRPPDGAGRPGRPARLLTGARTSPRPSQPGPLRARGRAAGAGSARLSLEQKVRLLTGADFWALHAEPAAGLRRVVSPTARPGSAARSWDERDRSANVPSPTALAATWDTGAGRGDRRPAGPRGAAQGRGRAARPDREPAPDPVRRPALRVLLRGPAADRADRRRLRARAAARGVGACVKHFVGNDSRDAADDRRRPRSTSGRCASCTWRRSRRSSARGARGR